MLQCPENEIPELLTLELYESAGARDEAFDALVAELGVPDRDDAECALGRFGRHRFESTGHAGVVACRAEGGQVDFVWTRTDEPVLLRATGGGSFIDYVQVWDELAGRTDGQFPLEGEQRLLDALPDEYLDDCRRDLVLLLLSGAVVTAACEPAEAAPAVVSWARFGEVQRMEDWFAGQRTGLDNTFDSTEDGCTPQGFGQPDVPIEEPVPDPDDPGATPDDEDSPPSPTAALMGYDLDGSSGQILCFVNSNDQNVLIWIRNGELIGSIAVSDRTDGATMRDLLLWWQDGGYRP